jgi:polyphenol oxidase
LITKKLSAEAVQNQSGGVETIRFPRLADPKVLQHAVSTRVGGVSRKAHGTLNISYKVQDEPVRVDENRELLSRALGMDLSKAVALNQVHSDKVLKLDSHNRSPNGGILGEGDGLITNETGVPLLIMVADCLPILFFDPVHKTIGLAHAGWRGTVSHVAPKTLLAMGETYGTKPEDVRAALGPCIGPCCYEVGEDVKREFEGVFPWGSEVLKGASGNHWKLDLAEANARQLLEVGMREENLIRSGLCTIQNIGLFYSHRAEATAEMPTGRVGAFMMLTS